MSQIPRSQLALKKKSDSTASIEKTKKHNGSTNGHTKDKDIIIIDDEFTAIPVGREEVVEQQQELPPPSQPISGEETSPMKKKRGRKPRESRDSDTSETSKKSEAIDDISEEILKAISAEDYTPEASPKQDLPSIKRLTRAERLQNASTIVNLSTISTSEEQSTKMSNDVTLETPSKPERRVSGRRSTRPIDEIKFSYRSPENANDSMNATIGSELENSIIETPAKRRAIDSIDDEVVESPKRSRLDISALFSNFTSPVSLLRNKFMRANIASTPKINVDVLNDSEVSLNASSELKEVDLNAAEEATEGDNELKIIVKPLKKSPCSIM